MSTLKAEPFLQLVEQEEVRDMCLSGPGRWIFTSWLPLKESVLYGLTWTSLCHSIKIPYYLRVLERERFTDWLYRSAL